MFQTREIPKVSPSYSITDPAGHLIQIPDGVTEDYRYFRPEQIDDMAAYYHDFGYVVIRGLIPKSLCAAARETFDREVKPYGGFIYRQTTANPERHVMTEAGYMLNPILNIQSLNQKVFPDFRAAGLRILTHPAVQSAVRGLLGEAGKLVQSMYFEGNPSTWAHQDTYYLDAEEIGRMTAGWFTTEDIAPGAGRFFIYPKSHLIDLKKNGGDFDVAFNHARYKKLVINIIQHHGIECRAPALKTGDVLFWSSKTIHGSLATLQPQRSRGSFTAHYIPASSRFLQFQSRIRGLNLENIGGMQVHKPKDLGRASNRAIFWIETTFPKTFQTAKKIAIKILTR